MVGSFKKKKKKYFLYQGEVHYLLLIHIIFRQIRVGSAENIQNCDFKTE